MSTIVDVLYLCLDKSCILSLCSDCMSSSVMVAVLVATVNMLKLLTFIEFFSLLSSCTIDGFVDKARVEEAEQKVVELETLVSALEMNMHNVLALLS